MHKLDERSIGVSPVMVTFTGIRLQAIVDFMRFYDLEIWEYGDFVQAIIIGCVVECAWWGFSVG